MYIPPGFGTVTPYFFANRAETLVEFLVQAFGGEEVLRSKMGSIAICVGWLLPEGSVPGSLGRWNSSSHKLWV